MSVLTAIFRPIFDLLLGPFQGLPAMVTLLPISIVVTIAALYVFKWTSDQEASEEAQRAILASIFEIRLFNDDLRAIFAAQLDVVWQVLKKLRYALVPLLWMLAPLFILVSQLQFHYGYSGFVEGDQVIVTAELAGEPEPQRFSEPKPAFRLEAPDGVTVETPALWIPALNQVAWRIRTRLHSLRSALLPCRSTPGSGVSLPTHHDRLPRDQRQPVRLAAQLDHRLPADDVRLRLRADETDRRHDLAGGAGRAGRMRPSRMRLSALTVHELRPHPLRPNLGEVSAHRQERLPLRAQLVAPGPEAAAAGV